jgi:Ca2+/H+ antiporter, TMEM165/GDT1 family
MMHGTQIATAVVAAFLASLVEFVEALTIVLAVGTTRGWRPALIGAAAGTLFLVLLTAALGPSLHAIPLSALQLVVGMLLLLFGTRWLRKAVLRAIGVIGLHNESAIYAKETATLTREGAPPAAGERMDWVAIAASFKAVILEGLEVIFIVIATGVRGMLIPASLGALLAGVIVIGAGILLRQPLARVPENTLKFAVGVLLSAFGVFWLGEGLGYGWPGEDLSLVGLIGGFALISFLLVSILRQQTVSDA